MDQQELRALERRCIQEESPECTAACPIHLDGRAFVGHVADGQWSQAWKVLHRTMPFPGILGRICDAPCRLRCKRGEVGDPIQIGALERACVATPPPPVRILPLPRKPQRVAVVGAGLSGLTAAWDLARKGYAVHVHEAGAMLGDILRSRFADRLDEAATIAELERLTALGVTLQTAADVEDAGFLEACRSVFDAVFISLDAVRGRLWGVDRDGDGEIQVTPRSQATGTPGVFAGGGQREHDASPVWMAAEGRWGATSIDRYLQNVSPTAGREKEGPYRTRLFTSLEGVAPLPAVAPADAGGGYSAAEAVAEAGRCLRCECLECVKVCAYLERFGAYPRKYVREIYNNESIVMGVHQANKLVNSCSLCGLCERVCPEDFAVQDLCLTSRRSMVQRGKMPPSAHEFALQDMRFSTGERFRLARHAPGRVESVRAFFPGCQLCASSPGMVERVYGHLVDIFPEGTGLMLGCCGAPAFWAGQEAAFGEVCGRLREDWERLGRPELILACSTCYRIFSEQLPQIPIASIWQVLDAPDLPAGTRGEGVGTLAVHDPCTTRPFPDIQEAVRRVLARLSIAVQELPLSRDKTECCGFGGLMQNANPDLAREVSARRARASELDYLAYCAMCRDRLAAVGKRALHLLDILFPPPVGQDPAERPRPGFSERIENRERLRRSLLKRFWNEEAFTVQPHDAIRLVVVPEVREVLERRRILDEDIRRVIHEAEKTGDRLAHPGTGRHKAVFRPYRTAVWVEYTPSPEGFVVHGAYTHRMEVVGGPRQ
jgi:glutamate synthase (NADPH) small chain